MRLNDLKYPFFVESDGGDLYAFLSPDRCFHLKREQYGKGDGFEFRIYKTRASVRRHMRQGNLDFPTFQAKLSSVFGKYLAEITSLIPAHILVLQDSTQLKLR